MANGAFKFKDNSGNVVSYISGSGANITFSGGTLDLSGMTGLTLGNLTMSGSVTSAQTASFAPSYLLTSSFNTYSGTTNTVIGTLQTSTSSLNSYTSSNTTNINAIHTSTGSLNTFTSSANGRLNSIEGKTGSYATTGSNTLNGNLTVTGYIDTQELRTTYISSSILYRSGSTKFGDELTDTHAFTGSLLVSGNEQISGSISVTGSVFVGASNTGDNIDYSFRVLRHGSLANPGTWSSSANALLIQDFSNDGPSTFDATGLVSIELPRVGSLDTNASNAIAFRIANDSEVGFAINGKMRTFIGANGSSDTGERLQVNGTSKFSSIITAASSGGSGLRIYGGSGTNQWDIYLTSTNLRVSDNTGTGMFVVDTTAQIYEFKISKRNDYATSDDSPWLFLTDGQAGGIRASEYGHVFIQSRSSAARGIGFITGTSPAERLWINSNGNIGVNTNNPNSKLQINTSSVSADSAPLLVYGFDGSAEFFSTRSESPYNGTIYLHNNPTGSTGGAPGIIFRGKSDTTNSRVQGSIYTNWSTTTDATRTSRMFFETTDASVSSVKMALLGNGHLGVGISAPTARLHVRTTGITAAAPSLGWPVYNAESDTNAKQIIFETDGNGNSSAAGYGATLAIVMGQYYDSRVVITPSGAGGGTPGDQGAGYGKDILIKGGTSDNGNGYRGGRLYLNGGAGYQGGYGSNVGDIFMQSIGSGGSVIIGSSYKNDSAALLQIGSLSNTGGGHLFKKMNITSGTATTFFTTNSIDGWCGVVEIFGVCDQDRNRVFYKLARFAYNRVFTEMISSEQNTATTSFSYSGNALTLNIGGSSGLGYYCMIRIMGSTL